MTIAANPPHSQRDSMLPVAQIVIAAAMTVAVTLAPPVHGRMLLLPGLARHARPDALITPDAVRLVSNGPLPGSLVVIADRATMLPAAWARGVPVIAAPPLLCGSTPADAR